jgi:hypothetical protein
LADGLVPLTAGAEVSAWPTEAIGDEEGKNLAGEIQMLFA